MRAAALPAKRIEFQRPCRIAHFEVDSSPPLDLGSFQWNGNAVVGRDAKWPPAARSALTHRRPKARVTKQSLLFHPGSAYHQRCVMRVPFLLSSESPEWANFTNTFSEVLLMLLGMTEGLNRTSTRCYIQM